MSVSPISRRHFCRASAAASAASICFRSTMGHAAAPAASNHFPQSVHDYYVAELRRLNQQAALRIAALKTKSDAEAYVVQSRAKIARSFGPWPEKTPLGPRITGVLERDTYRIEKVIFESRPEFFVTANLYLPKRAKLPAPGVVGACGHFNSGKAYPEYQSFAQGLARQGYVVLLFDAISLGERLQITDKNFQPRLAWGSREHSHLGNQQFLVGENLSAWFAWDGVRALDYLLSRDEVDPQHVGVTGNSGGGMETTWLCGADDRWTMAAPNCFVTTFLRLLENETANDTEQCPPRSLALGLDHFDYLAALAPKPIVILAQEQDFVDVRGTIEAFERLETLYTLLGARQSVKLYIGPGGHGYPRASREAMYAWFNQVSGKPADPSEPELALEEESALRCTKSGQVAELGNRPVYSFTRERAETLAASRAKLRGKELRQAVADLLKLPERPSTADYDILRPLGSKSYPLEYASFYALETEPGIRVAVFRLSADRLYSRPPRATKPAVLYVARDSSTAELAAEPLVREIFAAEPGATFYACDVRGLGESRPNTFGANSYALPAGCDYMYAIHSIMLDRPYVGRRVHDVLSVVDWLVSLGHASVHLVGRGYGAIPAALAALLHARVTQVTLKYALTSYREVAADELYTWPLSSFLPGVLSRFDLPDVYRELNAKNLRQIEPPEREARRLKNPRRGDASSLQRVKT